MGKETVLFSLFKLKMVNWGVFLFYNFKSGVKSPPPTNAHIRPGETPAQIICGALSWKQKDGAMLEIYDSPSGYRGVKTWEIGMGSESEKGSLRPRRATSNDSPTRAPSEPKKRAEVNRGHPVGKLLPRSLLFWTAMLFVMVPLERSVSRIFNAKWAKIQHFLPIQWIDFLL